ncbi:WD40-repeat-containing domain protein [Chytridium lagenaria]|nr:WD40-repeat-containing domain protein [Chytridium lagenaria]
MAMEFKHQIQDAHSKPILCCQYNPFRRELYSAGEAWGPSGKTLQKIETNTPIYCLAFNSRRQQLLVGHNKKVRVFQTISNEDISGHTNTDVLEARSMTCSEHSDIVSCMVSCEGRFYSAGYDRKLVIYDVPHHGDLRLRMSHCITNAHDAAISCMVFGKDADNSWLITGSFDRVVKLWSLDGNLLQRFDGFSDTITSVCYVLPTQTLWITASSPDPIVYDPRSGINVTDFVSANDDRIHQTNTTLCFKHLQFVPEINEVIGITNRRSIVIWKYNPVASVTVLSGHTDVVEKLAFRSDGLNSFMYSQNLLQRKNPPRNPRHSSPQPEERRKSNRLHVASQRSLISGKWTRRGLKNMRISRVDERGHKLKTQLLKNWEKTHAGLGNGEGGRSGMDLLVSGHEDSVWGYNEEAVKYVTNRVAGMMLKCTFTDHKEHKEELAADGIILDLEYCADRNEFAYASAIIGLCEEIKWNRVYQQWVTGSEDRTIRVWYVSASWDNTVRIWNGQRRITTKTASAFYANPNMGLFDDADDSHGFAEINPLMVPKLMSKPLFVKEGEKATSGDDNTNAIEQIRLEEELRSTLTDLEFALSGDVSRCFPPHRLDSLSPISS